MKLGRRHSALHHHTEDATVLVAAAIDSVLEEGALFIITHEDYLALGQTIVKSRGLAFRLLAHSRGLMCLRNLFEYVVVRDRDRF